jgi:hypothetical protein
VPILRHNSPDERRAFEEDKIVSNLPQQISGAGYRNHRYPPLWFAAFNASASS